MEGSSDVMDILEMSGHESRKDNLMTGDSTRKVTGTSTIPLHEIELHALKMY